MGVQLPVIGGRQARWHASPAQTRPQGCAEQVGRAGQSFTRIETRKRTPCRSRQARLTLHGKSVSPISADCAARSLQQPVRIGARLVEGGPTRIGASAAPLAGSPRWCGETPGWLKAAIGARTGDSHALISADCEEDPRNPQAGSKDADSPTRQYDPSRCRNSRPTRSRLATPCARAPSCFSQMSAQTDSWCNPYPLRLEARAPAPRPFWVPDVRQPPNRNSAS